MLGGRLALVGSISAAVTPIGSRGHFIGSLGLGFGLPWFALGASEEFIHLDADGLFQANRSSDCLAPFRLSGNFSPSPNFRQGAGFWRPSVWPRMIWPLGIRLALIFPIFVREQLPHNVEDHE